jgi:pyridoxamine 5'-phosphate oxidase
MSGTDSNYFEELRREYSHFALREGDVAHDPYAQFVAWLTEAAGKGLPEPNAVAVATATPDAHPSVRMVLLKEHDQGGLVFYTNYDGRKADELAQNPHAAMLFFWYPLERQVRIEGLVEQVGDEQSAAYFASRPRKSQLSAWASPQSRVVGSREALEQLYAEHEQRFEGKDIPRPPYWGGYRLTPDYYEFWQGRRDRLHDRLAYTREPDGSWSLCRLAP